MVGLLHAMAFMVLLLIGWVIWNNKPLHYITLHHHWSGKDNSSFPDCPYCICEAQPMLSHMLLQKAHFDNQLRFQKFTPVLELKAVWTH